jgi:hypothetical protein
MLLLLSQTPAAAQSIRARVVDDATRQPIAGATVTMLSGESVLTRVSSDANGFFRIRAPRAGTFAISVEMLGYATERREVAVAAEDLTMPAFVLKTQAIPVAPVEATARRNERSDPVVGFSRASHIVAGSRLATLEAQAARPLTLVREIGALRVQEYITPAGKPKICIEARRGLSTFGAGRAQSGCAWPVIVIDGVAIADPASAEDTFRTLQLRDMESFEYLTPTEAGHRYGLDASANGALVIWTRGRGPHVDPARNRNE